MSTHLDNFHFDDLPDVGEASTGDAARVPRFDGDVSELSNQACWVLQNLLTRRYLTKQDHPERWAWLMDHRKVLASRLCELDLRLRIHDDLEVAYAEPAMLDSPNQHSRRVLRREPMGTYASIVALHLAKILRNSHDEHVLISKADIHDLFGNVRHRVDRDEAMLRNRIDEAITKLTKTQILLRTRDDEDTYAISPVILAIMTGQLVDELSKEFEQLLARSADPDASDPAGDGDDPVVIDDEEDPADDA